MSASRYVKLVRLHQPIGIWLLFLPCLFGISLATKNSSDIYLSEICRVTVLFFLGSVLMRSAGCIINDLLDRKFDEKVQRTKNRPLVSREVTPFNAFILLAALLFLSFLILLQFNFATIVSGFFALGLVVIYPLMKRISNFPQIFLGLVFNFGIIMSSLALNRDIDSDIIIFYLSCVIWTLIYDTIYAFQDIEDDVLIGVKSSAIAIKKFTNNPKRVLFFLSFLMFLGFAVVGINQSFSTKYFLLLAISGFFIAQRIKVCDLNSASSCLKLFKENFWVGSLILIAIILG